MIEVQHVTKRYGRHTAVSDMHFSVDRGEIVGFLGPNGAGKTTMMNIITGYISCSEGSVKVDGVDVLENPCEVKKKIGYLPEVPPLYPEMTIREFLAFAGSLKGLKSRIIPKEIQRVSELVRISDMLTRLIRNISKGYRQRVGFAQALMGNPEVLILDEPTAGLDPVQIMEIRNLISKLKGNHTIILSSHILPEVSAVCSKVLIISRGKIAAEDTPNNLAKRISGASRLSLRISSGKKQIEQALNTLGALTDVDIRQSEESGAYDVLISANTDTDIRKEVFSALSSHGCPILLMRPADMSLEEIFLQVTAAPEEKLL